MQNHPNEPLEGNAYRQLPGIDALLQQMGSEVDTWGRDTVTQSLREVLAELRGAISNETPSDCSSEAIRRRVIAALNAAHAPSLVPVFNLTGTVLHTNLGRAMLPPEALDAIAIVASSASNLEFDLETGARGDRDSHVEGLICELTGAEAATVVNNNAAAVLLVLNTLALNREVPVSRGELVEIGGSFRIPEVMQRSGCILVETGSTNRTHLKDYRNAITDKTALLMKVHTSNYQVEGFTHAVEESELATLAGEHNFPLVVDMGSGNLTDFAALGLPSERTAAETITQGADIITFSGDKLLGGPQAGLIAGRADLIKAIKHNPLKRALRLDKMTLAGLAEVLRLYRDPQRLVQRLPTLRLLTRSAADIRAQARQLLPLVQRATGEAFSVSVADCHSQIGSGSLPVDLIASAALQIAAHSGEDADLRRLLKALRLLPRPIIGRLHKNAIWLDLRCLEPAQELQFSDQLQILSL
jgi:L-seryl-tRNA(Ser) seleniumtransferase